GLGLLNLLGTMVCPQGALLRRLHLYHLTAHRVATGFALLLLLGGLGIVGVLALVIAARAETSSLTVTVRLPLFAPFLALGSIGHFLGQPDLALVLGQGIELLDLLDRLLFPFLEFLLALGKRHLLVLLADLLPHFRALFLGELLPFFAFHELLGFLAELV